MKKLALVSGYILLNIISISQANLGSTCQISNDINGICTQVRECPQALAAFSMKPLRSEVVQYLRQLQCGFSGYSPLVCCSDRLDFSNIGTQYNPTLITPSRYRPRPSSVPSRDNGPDLLPPQGSCGDGGDENKILGGQVTDIDEFPWMVLLGYRSVFTGMTVFSCGGFIISKRYVITAAHCVTGQILTKVGALEIVRAGEHDTETEMDCTFYENYKECAPPVQDLAVETSIAHSGYRESNTNRQDDIGLVRVASEIEMGAFAQPICLPSPITARLNPGNALFVAGWGKTLTTTMSNVKLKLMIPYFDKANCDDMFSRSQRVVLTDRQICAGGGLNKDSCNGDSGGPLMLQTRGVWTAVGVVSFGRDCGKEGWPGVYTNVEKYMDWIRATIQP